MTGSELKATIQGLGLTQSQFAAICRVAPRTVRRWVSAKDKVPFLVEFMALAFKAGNTGESNGG